MISVFDGKDHGRYAIQVSADSNRNNDASIKYNGRLTKNKTCFPEAGFTYS
ncbi:MAG: hypothetical protein QM737_02070 [Ferruginibacter sp.]